MGRLTKAPELRTTPAGMHIASFGVATTRNWKDKQSGEKKEETEFHNVTAFGKTADVIAQYFAKGDEIFIQGRLKTNMWKAQDGSNRYRTDVIVEKMGFGQKSKANQGSQERREEAQPDVEPAEEEEINVENIPW